MRNERNKRIKRFLSINATFAGATNKIIFSVQGFKFKGTLESAPATIANIKVDPQTIRYPQFWTKEERLVKEKKISLLDELKPILKEKYPEKINQGLLHDEDASLGVVAVKSELCEDLLCKSGKI